jgi:hypothetical protein
VQPSTKKVFQLSGISLALSLVVLSVAVWLDRRSPSVTGDFLNSILPFFRDMVRPEREMSLYGLFILCNVLLMAAAVWSFKLTPEKNAKKDSPLPIKPQIAKDITALLLIGLFLYIPDITAVTARIFMGDQFHHFDQCVMGPAWAYSVGSVLDVDVISQYGLGMPIVMGWLMKLFGGINYENLLTVLVVMSIVYFALWYVFLRSWLGYSGLALCAVLFGILCQMFRGDAYPLVLSYPSATIMRFCFDAPVFLLLLAHLRYERSIFLVAASALTGLAVFYISSTGMCLVLGLFFYVGAAVVLRRISILQAFLFALIMPLTAVLSLWLAQGRYFFDPVFWYNLSEFNNYFLKGFGTIPISDNLADKKFYAFGMGILIPCLYVMTLTSISALVYLRKLPFKHILVAVLAVYGLGLYHYYIARSYGTAYFAVGLPYAFIVGYWINLLWSAWSMPKRVMMMRVLSVVLLFAFITTPIVRSYPNILNLRGRSIMAPDISRPLPTGKPYFHHLVTGNSRVPSLNSIGESDERLLTEKDFNTDAQLKEFYRQEFDLTQDAKLVETLIPQGQKAPIISSYDVKILMQSNRQPFFYHYPFFLSRPMRMRSFAVPAIYTEAQLKKTLMQMEDEKPPIIFIEAVYAPSNLPFANPGNGLLPLLAYVHSHYEPLVQGKYLVALKRK